VTQSVGSTSSQSPLQSIGGLGTGLDTSAIIEALVASKRVLSNPIRAQAQLADITLKAYGLIRTDFAALSAAAVALKNPISWHSLRATSSDTKVASVIAGSGTFGGTLSFTVDALATAGSVRSANTITGTSTVVTSATSLFVAAGGEAIGFSTFTSDAALALGKHTIEVTQASSAASKTGDSALAGSTTIDGTNDTLEIEVNGVAKTLTIAQGTYTAAQLADAVQDAADAAGAAISVSVSGSGVLSIETAREGSAATIQVTGGNALTALALSVDASAIAGTDGKVTVDDGTVQTIASVDAGDTVTLNVDGGGTIDAVVAGGLRTGTVKGANVSTGNGSLATVVANINAAGAGVTATAVQVGTNTYRLQLTSNTAGANNGQNIDGSVFDADVGGFVTLTEAADAQITVGEGPGAYTVSSSSNTISGLMPGVTVTLVSESATPVTITVDRDEAGIADKVKALVDAANKLKETIDSLTKYDSEKKQASPLTGDPAATRVLGAITTAFIGAVAGATPESPGLAGVSIDAAGKFTFDRAKFLEKFEADPEGVTRLFAQGGTADSGYVEFVTAGDRALAGTYAVIVTQVATQASTEGLTGAWPPAPLPTVKVKVGTTEVSYAVASGDTRADVAAGLNEAFASAGLQLQATDTGTGVQIATVEYGSSATFSVDWDDGGGYSDYSGQDVAGTIGGKDATGRGQLLTVPFSDTTLSGLSLRITTDTAGALGDFTYVPGVAQRVQIAHSGASDLVLGYLTTAENDYKARIKFINAQLADMDLRVKEYEKMIRRQWAQLETTISTMRSQSAWLSTQIAGLSGLSSSSR
jgi:flagellar hook-associated protein 2